MAHAKMHPSRPANHAKKGCCLRAAEGAPDWSNKSLAHQVPHGRTLGFPLSPRTNAGSTRPTAAGGHLPGRYARGQMR
eukprot:10425814-Lingulodinium_polyedra.AAC.1